MSAPIVTVAEGQLQGKHVTTANGKTYNSFQGIPYAKPPIGSLRFSDPQPAEAWDGVRDATSEGNVCAQIDLMNEKKYAGDENCLFLNVYSPNLDGEFLPVMVFIHGGGFKCGSGNTDYYGPDHLVEKDVVIVTINYRCGPLGFLCLNNSQVPGNAGIKDQITALQWVKDNIHHFGGNSGNVTLFGQSAGALACSLLMACPTSKSLINKVIIQSGIALNSFTFQRTPVDVARTLANVLGNESEDTNDILEFLRSTPVRELVEAGDKMSSPADFFDAGSNIWGAVVEREYSGVPAAITEPFIDILTSGRIAQVPTMIGKTTLEFCFPPSDNQDLKFFIPHEFHLDKTSEESDLVLEQIKDIYFNGQELGVENVEDYYSLLSDRCVTIDTVRFVKYLLQISNSPIYYYNFDYMGELNLSKKIFSQLDVKKSAHGDELGYLFKSDHHDALQPSDEDLKVREITVTLWTNFAKTGNPTPEENELITTTWPQVTKDTLFEYNINTHPTVVPNPEAEKMEFWERLYNKYFKVWNTTEYIANEVTPTEVTDSVAATVEAVEVNDVIEEVKEDLVAPVQTEVKEDLVEVKDTLVEPVKIQNGVTPKKPARTSNEIKMAHQNGVPKDVIRANDPPEDDLPKNIGVNKFVNFFESLGGKK